MRDPLLESREFYEVLRREVVPCMTLVHITDDGSLYYWPGFVSLWTLVGFDFVVVAYCWREGQEGMRQASRRWREAIRDPRKMKLASGHLVYMASLDAERDRLQVQYAVPGDWMGVYSHVKESRLHRLLYELPPAWPEEYRARIEELNRDRA